MLSDVMLTIIFAECYYAEGRGVQNVLEFRNLPVEAESNLEYVLSS